MTRDDVHSVFDFYAREGSTTSLQTRFGGSPPTHHEAFFGASADARRIVFDANGRWTPDDTDTASDVYTASEGIVERISLGPGTGNHPDFQAFAAGISDDGGRVLFETRPAACRAGRHVLRVGTRLRGGARLRPGRHRITLATGAGPPARLVVRLRRPSR